MALKLVNPNSIKQDPRGIALWWNDGDKNLYVVHNADMIFYFELCEGTDILHGENGKILKFGKISSDRVDDHFFKGARLVNLVHDVPNPVLMDLLPLLEECEGLEKELKEKIQEYLITPKSTDLNLTKPIENFDEYLTDIHVRAVKKRRRFKLKEWQQFLFIFVISVGGMVAMIVAAAMYVYKLIEEARLGG